MSGAGTVEPIVVGVIDDDPAIRFLMTEALSDEGYVVECWDGAEDPVTFIERVKPTVVLLDLRIAGWTSPWTVIDALRDGRGGLRVPVVVCTADAAFLRKHSDELRSLSCAIVPKPFDLHVLLAEVARCAETSIRSAG